MISPFIAFILDITPEDIETLLSEAAKARDAGQEWFRYEGRIVYVKQIFDEQAFPQVAAVNLLHTIRQYEWSQGRYRGDHL